MGASQSTIDAPSNVDAYPDLSPRSPHLLKLYRKEFERDEEINEEPELYLHSYGDDDADDSVGDIVPHDDVMTPAPAPAEDDDYPIETVNAHIDRTIHRLEPSKPSDAEVDQNEVPPSISQIFEQSRASTQEDLDAKFPKLPPDNTSRCGPERTALMQCHKEKEEVLHCRDLVDSYFQCARLASEELLRNRN